MKSKYNSPKSNAKNPTIPIDANDPRLGPMSAGRTKARTGSEIEIIGGGPETIVLGYNITSGSYIADGGGSKNPTPQPSPKKPSYEEVHNGVVNPKPNDPTGRPKVVNLGAVKNLEVRWIGEDIEFEFDFDVADPDYENQYVKEFGVHVTTTSENGSGSGYSRQGLYLFDQTKTHHVYRFTKAENANTFGTFYVDIASFCVVVLDTLGVNMGEETCVAGPIYVLDLNPPEITVANANNGYIVTVTNTLEMEKASFSNIDIWEIEDSGTTAPEIIYDLSGKIPTNYKRVYLSKINPAAIISPNLNKRWVIARFSSGSSRYTDFSIAVAAIPISPIQMDLIPPNEVVSVSAEWVGEDLAISYVLPATDPGTRFVAQLTPPGNNAPTGYFYISPNGSEVNQTAIIKDLDMYLQLGDYYSSFSGIFKSIDAADNRSAGVSFSIGQISNALAGIIPTFKVVNIVNGLSVTFDKPSSASFAEVYLKYTSWASSNSDLDYFTATCSASSSNEIVLTNIVDPKGNSVTSIPTGYLALATGVPEGTWITDVNQGQNRVTLNKTVSVSQGTLIKFNALVYSGTSPAIIQETTYADVYIKIRYYDKRMQHSEYSAESTGRALNPISVDVQPPPGPASSSAIAGIDESGILGFNGYIDVSWIKVTDDSVRGYRIRYTTDTLDPIYTYVDSPGNDLTDPVFRLIGLAVGAEYDIAVATYDQFNNTSAYVPIAARIKIDGTPTMSNYITAGDYGFRFGTKIDSTELKSGLLFNANNYWYVDGTGATFNVGSGNTVDGQNLNWNGQKLAIDGDITARGGSFSGNIALTTIGASIYNGDVTTNLNSLTGTGFIFNKDGFFARNSSGSTAQLTIAGGLVTNYGSIANWHIKSDYLENIYDGVSNRYVGLSSSSVAPYAIWAGANTSGNTNGLAKFSVTPDGIVKATHLNLSGTGTTTLDIGASSENLTTGFHVTNSGILYATGAHINGEVTATSGSIAGNLIIGVSGSISSGTTGQESGNAGFILNHEGLRFDYGTTQGIGITQLVASTGLFITKQAQIGGWNVDEYRIYRASSTNEGSIVLQSGHIGSQTAIYVTDGAGNNTAGILGARTANGLSAAIWAGKVPSPDEIDLSSSDPYKKPSFYVTFEGKLYANQAYITGGLIQTTGQAEQITLDANKAFISFGNATKSWLFQRTVNGGPATMLTQGDPFIDSANNNYGLDEVKLNSKAYLSIGPTTNSFGTVMNGIGLYSKTGLLNVTDDNGIGILTILSTNRTGMIINEGKLNLGSVKLKDGAPNTYVYDNNYSGIVIETNRLSMEAMGGNIQMRSNTGQINLFADSGSISMNSNSGSIDMFADNGQINLTAGSGTITMVSGVVDTTADRNSQLGLSKIELKSSLSGVSIYGIPAQKNDVNLQRWSPIGSTIVPTIGTTYYNGSQMVIAAGEQITKNGHYRNIPGPMGDMPRQRMIVEDPGTGILKVGMAVYYGQNETPTQGYGQIGDLWVTY